MKTTKDTPILTPREVKFIKLMASGKSKSQAGMMSTGSNSLASGATQATRMLKKDNVALAIQQAFQKHGITIDSAIAPIGKGLKAMKMNEFTGEITEDLKIQLSASDRALKLMNIGQETGNSIHFHQHIEEKKAQYDF